MWISKRRLTELEKRVADLERKVQDQQDFLRTHIHIHERENKEFFNTVEEVKNISTNIINEFNNVKGYIYKHY